MEGKERRNWRGDEKGKVREKKWTGKKMRRMRNFSTASSSY